MEPEYAKRIFKGYFRMLAQKSGSFRWEADNDAEIEAAIDDLMDTIVTHVMNELRDKGVLDG